MKRFNLSFFCSLTIKCRHIKQPRHEQLFNVKYDVILSSSFNSIGAHQTEYFFFLVLWVEIISEVKWQTAKRRMNSWVCSYVTQNVVISDYSHPFSLIKHFNFPATFRRRSVSFPITYAPKVPSLKLQRSQSSIHEGEEDPESFVQALKIPDEWLLPSKAIEVLSRFHQTSISKQWTLVFCNFLCFWFQISPV